MANLIDERSFTIKTRKFGFTRVYVEEYSTIFKVTVRPCSYVYPVLVGVNLKKRRGVDCLKAAELVLNREMIM